MKGRLRLSEEEKFVLLQTEIERRNLICVKSDMGESGLNGN